MDLPELEPTLGLVVETDRGSLPFTLIHGESLVACAAWALGEAGVTLVDYNTPWEALAEAEEPVVLHDVLCPMTPAAFLAEAVLAAEADPGAVVVGVRPVTDTVKTLRGEGEVGETLDREQLLQIASPVVLPPAAVAAVAGAGGLPSTDFAALCGHLAQAGFRIVTLEAPAEARRVGSPDDVRLVEALTAPATATPW